MNTEYKVLAHLEWRFEWKKAWTKRWQNYKESLSGITSDTDHLNFILKQLETEDAADDFYAQPFTTDLIIELFEGWSLEFDGMGLKQYEGPDDLFAWLKSDVIQVGQMTKAIFTYPQSSLTLADFITFCTLAGLPLYWKPEVVEKHLFLK